MRMINLFCAPLFFKGNKNSYVFTTRTHTQNPLQQQIYEVFWKENGNKAGAPRTRTIVVFEQLCCSIQESPSTFWRRIDLGTTTPSWGTTWIKKPFVLTKFPEFSFMWFVFLVCLWQLIYITQTKKKKLSGSTYSPCRYKNWFWRLSHRLIVTPKVFLFSLLLCGKTRGRTA